MTSIKNMTSWIGISDRLLKNATKCEQFNSSQGPMTHGVDSLLGTSIGYETSMERRVSGSGPLKMGQEYSESVWISITTTNRRDMLTWIIAPPIQEGHK